MSLGSDLILTAATEGPALELVSVLLGSQALDDKTITGFGFSELLIVYSNCILKLTF